MFNASASKAALLTHLHAVRHGDVLPVLAAQVAQRYGAQPCDGNILRLAHRRQAPHYAVLEHFAVSLDQDEDVYVERGGADRKTVIFRRNLMLTTVMKRLVHRFGSI